MDETTNGGRERVYRQMRESDALHRVTLSTISDAIFITDDDGRFTFICPNVDVIFGYSPNEVHGLHNIERLLGRGLFDSSLLAALGEIRNIEREVTAKSGEHRTLLIHVKAVSIEGGTVLYCCRDVTELKHAEEELRLARAELAHASRLALVGQLTASITHEVTQPLTAIMANASVGRQLAGQTEPLRLQLEEVFDDIHDAGRQAAAVIERLRALASKRPPLLRELDVNEVAADTLHFVSADARRRRVALRVELEPSLPQVRADRVCLQQVLLNLTLNAMDAMDGVDGRRRQVLLRTRRVQGGVEVAVSDAGRGIPPEHMARLFQPFFTTKQQGLGLGLAIAQSIVEAHRGRIWAEDHDGRGATFHVTLPMQA